MGNFARKIIDATQHTMLDRLAARSVPLIWLFSMWERLSPSDSSATTFALLVGGLVLIFLFWALGALANASPKPRPRSPYDQLHESPRSGFGAWDRPPEDGLRPPAAVRWLVMTFGRRDSIWLTVVELLIFFGTLALAWVVSREPAAYQAALPSWLAERSSPQGVFLVASAAVLTLSFRSWAVEQRDRVVHSARPPSRVVAVVFLFAFAAFIGMMLGDLFGGGLLLGSAIGVALVALTVLSPWRGHVVDALLGKQTLPAS